jgi:hypothetical protein
VTKLANDESIFQNVGTKPTINELGLNLLKLESSEC